jgi:hypothetical protein
MDALEKRRQVGSLADVIRAFDHDVGHVAPFAVVPPTRPDRPEAFLLM